VPIDVGGIHVFSAFVVMIRNNAFGRRLVENWMTFAQGLCTNELGRPQNFVNQSRPYRWEDSDQPGLWWAMAKTYSEFYHPEDPFVVNCTSRHVLNTEREIRPEMRAYFQKYHLQYGYQGKQLDQIPNGT